MKVVIFNDEAREKLKRGVDLIANAVKATLGPRGRNMIYGFHYGYPVVTKDGVTVARQVEAKDQTEQLGLLLVRQVAQKTADDAGDGTTTATLLAQEIFTEGLKTLKSGANPILIKRGIDKAVQEVIEFIDKWKAEVKDDESIIKVATLSANNDRYIGDLICDAVKKVGEDGVITIEDNYNSPETFVDMMEGMQLNEGLVSPYFITNPDKIEAQYQNVFLIIIDGDIVHINQVQGILEKAMKTGRPVALMANGFAGGVTQVLVNTRIKNNVAIMAIKNPYFGDFRTEQLIDLATLTGGRVIGPTTGLRPEEAELSDLGQCESFKATRHSTTIVGGIGKKEDVDTRITLIKNMIEKTESDYEKEKYRERLSKLTTGVAVIKVGAPTEAEQKEKKMRVEDALLATKAAISDGVLPGGGVTLLRAAQYIKEEGSEEELIGRRIVKKALRAPILQIAINSGIEGAEIIAEILRVPILERSSEDAAFQAIGFGYDFLNNRYGNLYDLGVLDPVKVVKATVINAASVAGLLLTTEVVANEEEEAEVTRTPKPKSQ